MKKIISVLLLVGVAFIGFKGYEYYNDTYKATMAYAIVPDEIPEKKEAVDDAGKKITNSDGSMNYTYDYNFNFVKENGESQVQGFGLTGSDPVPYEPGSYVRAEISNKRVVKGPYSVAESDVPKEILNKLK